MRRSRPLAPLAAALVSCLIAAVAIAAVIVAPAALGAGTPPTDQQVDQLFVQGAHHGTLTPTKKAGSFHLALHRTARQTHSIYCCVATPDHRAITQERAIPTLGFMNAWASFGFKANPPGAVLSLLHGAPAADTVSLRLSHPKTKHRGRRVSYHARILDGVGSNLQGYATQLDRRVPRHFNAASLYIDQETASVAGGCTPGIDCGDENTCSIQPWAHCPYANLREADLHGAVLYDSDFDYADLSIADLSGADLRGASMASVNLSDANLSYAELGSYLVDADLRRANLRHADLTLADLTGANLGLANLTGANLRDADLSGAIFCYTTMPDGSIRTDGCSQ